MRDTHFKQKETLTWNWKQVLRSKIGLMKQEFHSDETGNESFKAEKKLKSEVRKKKKSCI